MGEPAGVGNLLCLCHCLTPLSRWRIQLFSLLGLVPPLYCPWPLNWDYMTQVTLPFAGRVSNHGCSLYCSVQRGWTILPIDQGLTQVSSKAENAFVVWAEKEIPSNPVTTMASFFWAWNLSFCASIWNRWQMDVKMGHRGVSVTCHLCQGWEMSIHEDPPSSAYHVISSCWYPLVNTEGVEFSGLIFSPWLPWWEGLLGGCGLNLKYYIPFEKDSSSWGYWISLSPKDHRTKVLSFPLLLLLALGHSWKWKQKHSNFHRALGLIYQRETFCCLNRLRSNLVTRKKGL